MEDDDEEQDDDGDDEGLFTVVNASEAREIMNSRERQRRCKATTDPKQEAVNAKLGISFVCQVCDGIHHPDKKPEVKIILRGKKAGKYRKTAKPIPEGCEDMIPDVSSMYWLSNDWLCISAGTSISTPRNAAQFSAKPRDNEGVCVALADLDGHMDHVREQYLALRKSVLDNAIKTPFVKALRATMITREAPEDGICEAARKVVGDVIIGDHEMSSENIRQFMFPISTVLCMGGVTEVLDMTEDLMIMLIHVRAKMLIKSGRKNEKDCYTAMRRQLEADPRLELFHEHYLMVNTDPINRDCMVYEVPATTVTVKNALMLVDAGKARQVR